MINKNIENEPLVSVIVPVYNVESFLDECVDSILKQTYSHLELILVDDGSTDRSGAMCDSYEDNRVKVIHKLNKGQASARNVGIDLAKGDYLLFIDSDDYVSTVMIEEMMKCIERENVSIVCCNYVSCFSDLEKKRNIKSKRLNRSEAIGQLFDDGSYGVYAWNKLFKAEIFEGIRFSEGKEPFEDMETVFATFMKTDGICYIESALYCYRKRRNSSINEKNAKQNIYRIMALNKIMANCRRQDPKAYNLMQIGCAAICLYYNNAMLRSLRKPSEKLTRRLRLFVWRHPEVLFSKRLRFTTRLGLLCYVAYPPAYCLLYCLYVKVLRNRNMEG